MCLRLGVAVYGVRMPGMCVVHRASIYCALLLYIKYKEKKRTLCRVGTSKDSGRCVQWRLTCLIGIAGLHHYLGERKILILFCYEKTG